METFVIANILITPDNTQLISRHAQDFVSYIDTITHKEYTTAGGVDYFKHSKNGDERFCIIKSDNSFNEIREFLCRGTRGENDQGTLRFVPLKSMANSWIESSIKYIENSYLLILQTQLSTKEIEQEDYDVAITKGIPPYSQWFIEQYRKELVYRQLKKIKII